MTQSQQSSYILKRFTNPTHVSTRIQFPFSSLSAWELLARKISAGKTVLIRTFSRLPPALWGDPQNCPAFPAQNLALRYRGSDAGRDSRAREVPRALISHFFNDCWGLSMLWRLFVNTNKSEQFWATAPATHALLLLDDKQRFCTYGERDRKTSLAWTNPRKLVLKFVRWQ